MQHIHKKAVTKRTIAKTGKDSILADDNELK